MKATVSRSPFGRLPSGQAVALFTLTNAKGCVAKVTNYGTILTELHVPDRAGKLADIALGFDTLAEYEEHNGGVYFGCITGRVANRIAWCWADAALREQVLDDLLVDRRGGRLGFAPTIVRELQRLREFQAVPGSCSGSGSRT